MFVRHTVANYKTWRKAYDNFAPFQKTNGVKAQAVYQAADYPTDIMATHDFATVKAARDFARHDELTKARKDAGVNGGPTIWFTNKV
jgi:hypothetical protein